MNVVITVEGREAIPVRAIPFVTGWMVSPDVVAESFARTDKWVTSLNDLVSFSISPDGSISPMLPKEWDGIEADLELLSDILKAQETIPGSGYPEWRRHSIPLLPSHTFVWRDQFEQAFKRAYGPGGMLLLDERPGDRELNFSPRIPSDLIPAVFEGVCTTSREPLTGGGTPERFRGKSPKEVNDALLRESEAFVGKKKDFHAKIAKEFGVGIERIRSRLKDARKCRIESESHTGIPALATQIHRINRQ